MSSLSARLILWIWISLVTVGAASAGFTYWRTAEQQGTLLDLQMQEVAHLAALVPERSALVAVIKSVVDVDFDHDKDFDVAVLDGAGNLIASSTPESPLPDDGSRGWRTTTWRGEPYRIYSEEANGRTIIVAQEFDDRSDKAFAAAMNAMVSVLVMIPALALVTGAVIRRLLRPVREIASEVASRPPLESLPLPLVQLPTEVRPLIEEINRLLERQSAALQREQRFIADAAHALRTPLTAIQLQADVLVGAPTPEERARRLGDLRAGIARAIRIANSLLAIANDEPIKLMHDDCTDLDIALAEIAEAYRPIAESGKLMLVVESKSNARVRGAQRHLALLVGNILDNALRYTPAGGRVTLRSGTEGDRAVIEVEDEGPGVAELELERVFERFYRGAGDVTQGNGLGLAAVRSIARRLGGDAFLYNREDRTGLIAKILLPKVS